MTTIQKHIEMIALQLFELSRYSKSSDEEIKVKRNFLGGYIVALYHTGIIGEMVADRLKGLGDKAMKCDTDSPWSFDYCKAQVQNLADWEF